MRCDGGRTVPMPYIRSHISCISAPPLPHIRWSLLQRNRKPWRGGAAAVVNSQRRAKKETEDLYPIPEIKRGEETLFHPLLERNVEKREKIEARPLVAVTVAPQFCKTEKRRETKESRAQEGKTKESTIGRRQLLSRVREGSTGLSLARNDKMQRGREKISE